jgi:hypothetical protein
MLGGQWKGDEEEEGGEEGGAAAPGPGPAPSKHPVPKGKASRPMAVDEFLDKGVGGAQLPRKR